MYNYGTLKLFNALHALCINLINLCSYHFDLILDSQYSWHGRKYTSTGIVQRITYSNIYISNTFWFLTSNVQMISVFHCLLDLLLQFGIYLSIVIGSLKMFVELYEIDNGGGVEGIARTYHELNKTFTWFWNAGPNLIIILE